MRFNFALRIMIEANDIADADFKIKIIFNQFPIVRQWEPTHYEDNIYNKDMWIQVDGKDVDEAESKLNVFQADKRLYEFEVENYEKA